MVSYGMKTQKLDRKHARTWRVVTTVLLVALALIVLQKNRKVVSSSLTLTAHANFAWAGVSVLLMAVTFCLAATIYGLLALRPLRYLQTLLVEVAAAFVGRLLPAGIGGLGLNGVYLYKRKHTAAEATVVTSVNNLIGMCTHVLLICLILVFRPHVLSQLLDHEHVGHIWEWVGVAILLVLLLFSYPPVRHRIRSFAGNLLVSVRKEKLKSVSLSIALSALLTAAYTLILFCTSRAVGVHLSLAQIFIAFTVGVFVGTVTPAPGGLIGTEAGLFSAFVSFGISNPNAGAAVLLFRLVTYWLPLLPGALALAVARDKKLV